MRSFTDSVTILHVTNIPLTGEYFSSFSPFIDTFALLSIPIAYILFTLVLTD